MAGKFDICIIFAEMRTGSNHLEALLDAVPGISGLGEVFNPTFVGRQKQEDLLGFDLSRREADPTGLYSAIKEHYAADLPVIRFFHDHDARVLDPILADKRVAKVILTRNPLDSYISRKIAAETGQWRMTDAHGRKSAEVRFDRSEFEMMLNDWQTFSATLRHGLQSNGQTAFEIRYSDLSDAAVLNGLLRFLGSEEDIDLAASKLKPQNPGGPMGKVLNPAEMEDAIAKLDPFGLTRPYLSEVHRAAGVKGIAALPDAGLMFMPVPGVLEPQIDVWIKAIGKGDPQRGLSQRELRQWMRRHPGHLKFSVLQHPLARAHAVFCSEVLPRRPALSDIRQRLRRRYEIPLPQDWPDDGYDVGAHKAAFLAFLKFLKPCLAGQMSLAPRHSWSSQIAALQGMAGFAVPDRLLRAESLESDAQQLLGALGIDAPSVMSGLQTDEPFTLAEIYDQELEDAAREAYRRDYVFLGFSDWSDQAA